MKDERVVKGYGGVRAAALIGVMAFAGCAMEEQPLEVASRGDTLLGPGTWSGTANGGQGYMVNNKKPGVVVCKGTVGGQNRAGVVTSHVSGGDWSSSSTFTVIGGGTLVPTTGYDSQGCSRIGTSDVWFCRMTATTMPTWVLPPDQGDFWTEASVIDPIEYGSNASGIARGFISSESCGNGSKQMYSWAGFNITPSACAGGYTGTPNDYTTRKGTWSCYDGGFSMLGVDCCAMRCVGGVWTDTAGCGSTLKACHVPSSAASSCGGVQPATSLGTTSACASDAFYTSVVGAGWYANTLYAAQNACVSAVIGSDFQGGTAMFQDGFGGVADGPGSVPMYKTCVHGFTANEVAWINAYASDWCIGGA